MSARFRSYFERRNSRFLPTPNEGFIKECVEEAKNALKEVKKVKAIYVNCPCCGKRVPLKQIRGLNPPGYIRIAASDLLPLSGLPPSSRRLM